MSEQIHKLLAELRLRGMAAVLDAELERAEREGSSPAEFSIAVSPSAWTVRHCARQSHRHR